MDLIDNFHEITGDSTTADAATTDIRHVKPNDRTGNHVWVLEPATATGVLTQDGITQIAFHQYRAGTYTFLDNLLNPMWTNLTELLPMTMAPNLVTTLGALHCLVSYLVTWHYSPTFSEPDAVPAWLLILNAYCMFAYYTLDCMDGKQARRTGSSSPLGQLFDHGVDCICNLSHVSMVHSWLCAGSGVTGSAVWVVVMSQSVLQFSFFVAQWEEYYTGSLPHATGDFGVTEVNYGMGVLTLLNAALVQQYRQTLYTTPLSSVTPVWLMQMVDTSNIGISSMLSLLPTTLAAALDVDLEIRHALLLGFAAGMAVLIGMSASRVLQHASVKSSIQRRMSALSKLVTPGLLAMAPLLLPPPMLQRETRHVSLVVGLALCLVTIKLIVFGMAKRSYAVVQMDAVPALAVLTWIRCDRRFTDQGRHALLVLTTVWYLVRIYQWTGSAIRQICQRLDIYLFTIKAKVDIKAESSVNVSGQTKGKPKKSSSGITDSSSDSNTSKSKSKRS
jgi:ethanolaminephosphotransferase